MNIEEILSIAVQKAKDTNVILQKSKSINDGLESVKMVEAIKPHAVKGVFPENLFKHRSPNQTEKEAKYIKENYKNVTLPIFLEYINTITRCYGDGNWSITYKEDKPKYAENTFKKYVESELPTYTSLEQFQKFVLPTIKTMDANGYLTVRPKYIDYIEDESGDFIVNSQELYKPSVNYFESKEVIEVEENIYALFLSKEKSAVRYYDKDENSGSVFELYTKDEVYFIKQVGNKIDNKFEVELFFQHNENELPITQLKGIPTIDGDDILWQSPFLYSVDLLDLVAINANWLQASVNSCVFPVKVMYGSPCEFKDTEGQMCQGGYITNIDGLRKECTSCNGIGLKSRISPIGTLLLNPTTKFEAGEDKSTQDPLRYISPEVHTLEFLSEKIEKDRLEAKQILHIRNKNSKTQTVNDITATEVFDDAKAMTAFVKPISDQMFDIYYFCLKHIGKQRYFEDFEMPDLSYPKSFDFKTPEDYLIDVNNALKANLPPSFVQTILMQYINSFYADNTIVTKIFKLIASADRIFGLTQNEITLQLAKGTIAKWEQILNTSIFNFISDLIREDNKFLDLELQQQIDKLYEKAKSVADEINSTTDIYNSLLPTA